MNVYNAFIMPYDSMNKDKFPSKSNIINIGEATGEWKENLLKYERVQGILLDITSVIHHAIRNDESQIAKLVESIQSGFIEVQNELMIFESKSILEKLYSFK